MKDQKTKERFMRLRASGLSYANIASKLGVSKQTLITWSKDLATEINNMKTISLDALQEEYCVTKSARIQAIGEQMRKVKEELSKRDLSAVSTDKLLKIFVTLSKQARNESIPIKFRQMTNFDEDNAFLQEMQELNTWEA